MLRIRDYRKAYKIRDAVYRLLFVRKMPPVVGWKAKDLEGLAGSCCYAQKKICVVLGQSPEDRLFTAIHELYHAADEEWKIGLTHDQIYKLEKATGRFLLDNDLVA